MDVKRFPKKANNKVDTEANVVHIYKLTNCSY